MRNPELSPILKRLELIQEKVELLNGDKSATLEKSAIRRKSLDGLSRASNQRSKKAAGSAPTKAEFDRLVTDVQSIIEALRAVLQAVQDQ